jgi:hypothetical protein
MFKDVKVDKLQIVTHDGWNKFPFVDSDYLK